MIADGQSLESFKDIGEQNKHGKETKVLGCQSENANTYIHMEKELDDQVPEEAKAMSENAHAGGADTMSSKKRNHAEAAMEDAIPEKRQRTDATSSTSLSGVGSRSSDMTSHPPSQAGPFGDSSARAEYGPRRNQLSRSRDIVGNVNALALRRNRLPAYDSDSEEVDVEALLDLFQVRRHADQVRDNRARRQREAEAAMAATAATAATTTPSGQDATRENLATDLFVEQDPQDDTTP